MFCCNGCIILAIVFTNVMPNLSRMDDVDVLIAPDLVQNM